MRNPKLLKLLLSITLVTLSLVGSACATRPAAIPEEYASTLPWGALDLDIHNSGSFTLKDSLGTIITKKVKENRENKKTTEFNILTLSGGGTRGAYGAGIIYGWNDRGDIPKFDIVTGVSTGAVMASFVFLGGDELTKVKNFYTKSYTDDVYTSSWFSFFQAYLMNPAPLKALFRKNFNNEFLDRVAAEHHKGRRLYIGSTNLDTGQLIVWDMGAIAASNRSDKYQRFADIIYASSAMPMFLPPQYMYVDIKGKQYTQMHVDGGIYSHVFMVGLLVNWTEVLGLKEDDKDNFDVTLYTVANRKYRNRHAYDPVEQSPASIINAYVEVETDLLFDRSIYRLYKNCLNKGIKFRMTAVPEDANSVDDATEFNPKKMTELFNIGYAAGLYGIKWKKEISLEEYDYR